MNLKFYFVCVAAALSMPTFSQVMLRYGGDPDKGWGDASSVITPYVSFPAEMLAPYDGNEITTIRIAVMEEGTNCYIYIKNKPDDQKYIYRQKLESLRPGWNEITLDTPFPVSGEEAIAIGYKASFQAAGGVGITNEKIPNADYIYYNSQNRWTSTNGAICIMAVIDGDKMPENEMMISSLREEGNEERGEYSYSGYVRNVGNNPVESYTITVRLDGEEVETLTGEAVDKDGEAPFRFTVNCSDSGNHVVTAEITEVNGTSDSYAPNNIASATFSISEQEIVHRIVCEEYTGTWCGFCPRGMVGLEMMSEEYPDTFIPIAIHGSDPMEIGDSVTSYAAFIEGVGGAPECNVDRRLKGDPYYDIRQLYELESKMATHIGVDATCSWNDDFTALEVVTTYYSDTDLATPNLNIAYTVTESGITGYPQTNYYAGGRNGELYGWEEKTDPATDVTFNHVARAIYGGYWGMQCQTDPMTAYEPYTHTYTVPVPENVTDINRLTVIPQIIDGTSNRIINAVALSPEITGIENVAIPTTPVRVSADNGAIAIETDSDTILATFVYTPDGRLIASDRFAGRIRLNLPEGIYITVIKDNANILKRTKIIL